ncbi:MAG TPA: DUF6188 family protein [Actinoplanes sp.]|jgi:hypothetical protein|nr:DUF6188 family protein [Actinoplanes sp.]
MDLGFAGQKVVAEEFGYTVGIDLTGGYEVRIETGFLLRAHDGDHHIVPGEDDGDAALLGELTGQVVTMCTADDAGALRVDFDSGARLLVEADPAYEAWTVAGPGGLKVVCLPGGELSIWSPQP